MSKKEDKSILELASCYDEIPKIVNQLRSIPSSPTPTSRPTRFNGTYLLYILISLFFTYLFFNYSLRS